MPGSMGISYSSALEGKACQDIKESAQGNINTSGVECYKDGKQTVGSPEEVLSATTL